MLRRLATVAAAFALLVPAAAACGGDDSAGGGDAAGSTITYWASNQGPSLEKDKEILRPELDRFTRETGVTVELEVVGWPDLLNRILAAATSGEGPDVLNIGNTWSPSLQATGALMPWDDAAFSAIGGKDRFLTGSLSATGAAGKDPTAVPLYSLAYGLYYNKKLFAEAGITAPPTTWEELVAAGRKLTGGGRWGLAVEGGNISENAHHAFVFGKQYGGDAFDASGKAQFDAAGNVAGIKRYLDLMAVDKIVNPSNAEYAANQSLSDFANGKAAMLLWQAADSSLKSQGMSPDEYGVVPVPLPASPPPGGEKVTSMVAGINLAVFESTENKDAAMRFVEFMTSDATQISLNKTYGSLPSVRGAYSDAAFTTPTVKTFQDILATSAAPMPAVPEESQYETLVGTAMKALWADIASGRTVGEAEVRSRLADATKQVKAGG